LYLLTANSLVQKIARKSLSTYLKIFRILQLRDRENPFYLKLIPLNERMEKRLIFGYVFKCRKTWKGGVLPSYTLNSFCFNHVPNTSLMNVQTKRAPIVLPKKKEKQTKKQAIIRFITPFTHLIERKKQEHKRKRTSKFHLIGPKMFKWNILKTVFC